MDTTIKRTSSGVKRKKRVAGCMILVLLLGGCEDLFEKDISEKRECLIAPADSIRTPHREQNFVWEEVSGASGYRLEVAKPGFERPEFYLLDTLVTGNKYSFTLDVGTYEWRVRPENSAYKGLYSVRRIVVLPSKEE